MASPASPTFRTDLAKLVSPLKRILRVPFWQLAAHRIPTLSLYRGLLRNAATDNVRLKKTSELKCSLMFHLSSPDSVQSPDDVQGEQGSYGNRTDDQFFEFRL